RGRLPAGYARPRYERTRSVLVAARRGMVEGRRTPSQPRAAVSPSVREKRHTSQGSRQSGEPLLETHHKRFIREPTSPERNRPPGGAYPSEVAGWKTLRRKAMG